MRFRKIGCIAKSLRISPNKFAKREIILYLSSSKNACSKESLRRSAYEKKRAMSINLSVSKHSLIFIIALHNNSPASSANSAGERQGVFHIFTSLVIVKISKDVAKVDLPVSILRLTSSHMGPQSASFPGKKFSGKNTTDLSPQTV